MKAWTTYYAVINEAKIRLDTLDLDGKTAGWVVRRACNVFQAYLPPTRPVTPEDGQGHDAVVDLLRDGVLLGQAGDMEGAHKLIQDALGLEDTATLPALNIVHRVEPARAE